jgi:hypothetical protein
MATKQIFIDRIVDLGDGTIAVVLPDETDATLCLRRNPRCSLIEKNGEHILVYNKAEIDLTRAIKRL